MEEEIRLLYVAVTRARRSLDLYLPHIVRTRGPQGLAPGCSLLDGIDDLDDLVDRAPFVRPRASRDTPDDLLARLAAWLDR